MFHNPDLEVVSKGCSGFRATSFSRVLDLLSCLFGFNLLLFFQTWKRCLQGLRLIWEFPRIGDPNIVP